MTRQEMSVSDLRNNSSEPVIETNFARPAQFDYSSEKIDLSGEGIESSDIRPLDENSDMAAFRTVEPEDESPSTKILAVVAVAFILGSAGVAGYMSSVKSSASAPAIAAAAPAREVAAAPPPMPTPVDNTPNTATPVDAGQGVTPATTTPEATPAPVKPARSAVRSARLDVTPKPDVTPEVPEAQPAPAIGQQQQAAIPSVPEPVSPSAPASSLAANTPALTPSMPEQAPADEQPPAQNAPQEQQAQNEAVPPVPEQAQPAPVEPQPDVQAQPAPETVPAQPQ